MPTLYTMSSLLLALWRRGPGQVFLERVEDLASELLPILPIIVTCSQVFVSIASEKEHYVFTRALIARELFQRKVLKGENGVYSFQAPVLNVKL